MALFEIALNEFASGFLFGFGVGALVGWFSYYNIRARHWIIKEKVQFCPHLAEVSPEPAPPRKQWLETHAMYERRVPEEIARKKGEITIVYRKGKPDHVLCPYYNARTRECMLKDFPCPFGWHS